MVRKKVLMSVALLMLVVTLSTAEHSITVEDRHNDQLAFNLSSTLQRDLLDYGHIAAGVNLNTTKGMRYKTTKDLLGADHLTDIDKFFVRDYGYNSSIIQNDLDSPNRTSTRATSSAITTTNARIHLERACENSRHS